MLRRRNALPVRYLAVLGGAVLLLGSCTDEGDDDAAPTTTTVEVTTTVPAPDGGFCDSLQRLATGGIQDPDVLGILYADIEANAPAEIRDEVETFVEHSRAVSDAIAEATDQEGNVDTEAALESLSSDERQFVDDLAESSDSGDYPPGSAGTVLRYLVEQCPEP